MLHRDHVYQKFDIFEIFCFQQQQETAERKSCFGFKVLLFLFLFLHFYSKYTACEMAWEKHINFLTLVHHIKVEIAPGEH